MDLYKFFGGMGGQGFEWNLAELCSRVNIFELKRGRQSAIAMQLKCRHCGDDRRGAVPTKYGWSVMGQIRKSGSVF